MLSRYTDFTQLGQGGMGVVYRATDSQLHRAVALKFVTSRFGSEDQARARFLREARMAAALNHPAICTIYEVGEVQPGEEGLVGTEAPFPSGTPFIAMELIEGQGLDAVLRERGRFAPAELLDIAIPIAEALATAHAKAIVHRDLKPANVMITPEGRPKILDFGLAKLVTVAGEETATETESAELTRRGQVLGTVAYMSPEQAQGKQVDSRSDNFSFGVMLYELAAGERPFRGDTPTSTLAKIIETEPKPLGDIRNDLPGELLRIVRRCLRKKPEERFQSTGDLVVALRELKQESVSGPTQGWSDAVPAARHRSRGALAVVGSIAALIAALALGAVWLSGQRATPKPEPVPKQITSNPPESPVHSASISPDGRYLAFADPTGAYLRVLQTGETRRILAPETLDVTGIGWFPDGTRLAMIAINPARQGVSSWTLSVLGGAPRKLRDNAIVCAASPDGSRLYFFDYVTSLQNWTQNGIWVMGPDGEGARPVLPKAEGADGYESLALSPDGKKLLFVRGGESNGIAHAMLGISDMTGASPTLVLSDPKLLPNPCSSNAAWLPDGRILFTLAEPPPNQTSANFWELRIDPKTHAASGAPRRLTNWAGSCITNLDVLPEGRQLTFLKQRRQSDVYVGELKDNGDRLDNVRRLTLDEADDFASGWARDSKAFRFASNRQGTFDVFMQRVDAQTAEAVVQGPGSERAAALSPDGSLLLYQTHPPGLDSAPDRLMRVPIAGGAPEVILEQNDLAGFACPTLPTASCVLRDFKEDTLTFFLLDPMKGKGREIGRVATPFPLWSLSPDGSRIAFVGGEPGAEDVKIRSMNVSDGAIENFNVKGLASPSDVAWSADGKSLFITEFVANGPSPGWYVVHADLAGHLRVLERSNIVWGGIANPQPSPDGRYLAFEKTSFESNAWSLENF